MNRNVDRSVRGVFIGWVTGTMSRVKPRPLAVEVRHETTLGQPRVALYLQREAPAKLRPERGAISLLCTEAFTLGGEILATAFSVLAWAPTNPTDEAELARVRLAMGAAFLLAKLTHDAGRPREHALRGIEHALIGCLWKGDDIEQIAQRAVALVWDAGEAR